MFSNEDYLAELLAEAGMVSIDDVSSARSAISGAETVVEYLLAHNYLTQEEVARTLATNAGVPFIRLADVAFDPAITASISEDIARRYRVIPLQDEGFALTIALADPLDFEALDTLPHVIGRELNLVCVTHQDIQDHLRQLYPSYFFARFANNDLTYTLALTKRTKAAMSAKSFKRYPTTAASACSGGNPIPSLSQATMSG